ncbi:hypothetical protein GCM10009566_17660 [Streptomyces murinus]
MAASAMSRGMVIEYFPVGSLMPLILLLILLAFLAGIGTAGGTLTWREAVGAMRSWQARYEMHPDGVGRGW